MVGGGGRDGSGAGAWALGEGAVVLGSLAVPTRAMCGEGAPAVLLVRGELATPPGPVAGLCPCWPVGGSPLLEPGTGSGRIPPRWWSTPPTPVETFAKVATVSTIMQTATTSGRLPRTGARRARAPGRKRAGRRRGRQESTSQRMISAQSASSRPRRERSPLPVVCSVIAAR
jgi:hypothetical protein